MRLHLATALPKQTGTLVSAKSYWEDEGKFQSMILLESYWLLRKLNQQFPFPLHL